ncbi:MAG TPA: hypothetical protein VFT74_10605, partial [Isosphaeraceae bacterium]|nr:hypothetical protein [Isosphaeraceae bacterium]
ASRTQGAAMSTPSRLPREQVDALRPGDVKLYLTSRGWVAQAMNGSTPKAVVLHHPNYRGVELLLPMERSLGDFALRMGDVVAGLAQLEDRPLNQVLNDLSMPPGDVFRVRVAGSVASLGNLPLDEALRTIEGGRKLLWASAHSVLQPQAILPQRRLQQVDEFLKSCRLGQTERGSFIATILAPVTPEIQPALPFPDESELEGVEPFERRVTTRLMESLGLVSHAIRSGETGRILDSVDRGVSANLCEALAEMEPQGDDSSLNIQVTWARTRSHLPANIPNTVSFPQEDFPSIAEAGRLLRVRAIAKREPYTGKVINVKRAVRSLIPGSFGWMVITTEVGGGPARVKVDLTQEDWDKACGALQFDRRVALTGIIRHDAKGREYVLSEPRDFRVIEEP